MHVLTGTPCAACKATGTVDRQRHGFSNNTFVFIDTCVLCNGTGLIDRRVLTLEELWVALDEAMGKMGPSQNP